MRGKKRLVRDLWAIVVDCKAKKKVKTTFPSFFSFLFELRGARGGRNMRRPLVFAALLALFSAVIEGGIRCSCEGGELRLSGEREGGGGWQGGGGA